MGTRGVPRLENLRPWIFCQICGDELRATNGVDVPSDRHLSQHREANATHHWALDKGLTRELRRLAEDGPVIAEGKRESAAHKVLCALGFADRVDGRGRITFTGPYVRITEAGRKWLETEREKKK